tara:strand:- start:616 stop:750 length:135 start_codon:yes stop_codon:yes gene_type:complete
MLSPRSGFSPFVGAGVPFFFLYLSSLALALSSAACCSLRRYAVL